MIGYLVKFHVLIIVAHALAADAAEGELCLPSHHYYPAEHCPGVMEEEEGACYFIPRHLPLKGLELKLNDEIRALYGNTCFIWNGLFMQPVTTVALLSQQLGLPPEVVQDILQQLADQQLVSVNTVDEQMRYSFNPYLARLEEDYPEE